MKRIGLMVLVILGVLGVVALLGRGLIAEKLTLKRGADAYLIGYPLVTMAATRDAVSQTPNTFTHVRYLPDGQARVNVVSPSRDLYYSSAWLDLTDSPVIIEQPDMGDTFWLMPVLDAWTNVIADPGTRTLGNSAHRLVIAGPDWRGTAPPGTTLYRSPTNLAWAILRIEAGADPAVLQDGFRIAPLDDPGAATPARVLTAPTGQVDVRAEVDALPAEAFFTRLAEALQDTPIEPDAAATLARVGVAPGAFDAPTGRAADGLAQVPGRVQQGMTDAVESGEGGTVINGWRVPPMILGDYGTEYPVRAVVAREGLGANLPEDAVYASTTVDARGEPLEGGRTYTVEIPADVPVGAFWSLSLYDREGAFLPGPARGLSVSGRGDEPATRVTVSPQRVPGAWLRAPQSGPYRLLLRLYWPDQVVLDNQWPYPTVTPR